MHRRSTSTWQAVTLVTLISVQLFACAPPSTSPASPTPSQQSPSSTGLPASAVSAVATATPLSIVANPCAVPDIKGTPCVPPATWSMELTVSGGIAGITRRIALDSTGNLTIEDQGTPSSSTIDEALADSAADLLCQAGIGSDSAGPQPSCADCFGYELSIVADGRSSRIAANDLSLRGSPARPLIEFLNQLATSGTPTSQHFDGPQRLRIGLNFMVGPSADPAVRRTLHEGDACRVIPSTAL